MERVCHVLGIGHCPTDRHFSTNPFAQNTRMMCAVLKKLGFTVRHYGVEGSTADCDEHISVVTLSEMEDIHGKDFRKQRVDFNTTDQRYTTGLFNTRAVHEIGKRGDRGDLILAMGGTLHQTVVSAFDDSGMHPIEPACGYPNIFTRYRVFPSYTWQNSCYSKFAAKWETLEKSLPEDQRGSESYLTTSNPLAFQKPCDGVIPHGCFSEDFEVAESKDDYILQVSRIIPSKGIEMAVNVAKHLGRKLVIAGHGDFEKNMGFKPPSHVELIGPISVDERKKWMSKAYCLMAWSIYPEAFGYAPVEFMFSGGYPVVSDLGAFTETVEDDVSGFRTASFKETCEAVEKSGSLDPKAVRQYAIDNFSIDAITPKYGQYFKRLDAHFKAIEADEDFYHLIG